MSTDKTRLMHHETNGPLTHLLNNLSGEEGKIWLHQLKKFLRKEDTWTNNHVNLKQERTFHIHPVNTKKSDFFKIGNGITKLWLSNNFKNIFLPLVNDTIIYKGGKVEKFKLIESMNDFQINEEISGGFETPTEIAAMIISLISAQPNGEDGVLLNNGYANIFYFKHGERLFYVRVSWDAVYEEWDCRCYEGGAWQHVACGPLCVHYRN